MLKTYVVAMNHCMECNCNLMHGECRVLQVYGLDIAPLVTPLLISSVVLLLILLMTDHEQVGDV